MDLALDKHASTMVWSALSGQLEEFAAAWTSQPEPDLASFLPPASLSVDVRQMVLIELVKYDLEQRALHNCLRPLDEYGREFPEMLDQGEPPLELIYEDFHVRRTAGLAPTVSDYAKRYPKQADGLKRMLGESSETYSTQLYTGKQGSPPAVGQRLDDFELLVELGKGAFGSVFLAKQVSMARLVALKISAAKGSEPQTLAQLDHPNIIRVFDQRTVPEQRLRLMYMQLAPGGTLEEVVDRVKGTKVSERDGSLLAQCVIAGTAKTTYIMMDETTIRKRFGQMPWPEVVCRLGMQLAQALYYACNQGILHRDVKPANVLLAVDGSPKLADFNISFCSQLDGATPAAYFGGSLAYMSPEQLEAYDPRHPRRPQDLTGQSDLYSLAVVMWELLHGERPFRDEKLAGGMQATLTAMIERRHQKQILRPDKAADDELTQRLEGILLQAMSPEPAQRPVDGDALARELALALHPRTWELFHTTAGWVQFARRHPFITYTLLTVPPFLVAGIYNFFYNEQAFIAGHGEVRKARFEATAILVNSLVYPVGMGIVLIYVLPFARALSNVMHGRHVPEDVLERARLRSLRIGYCIMLISLLEWFLAGVAFSAALQLPLADSLRFILVQLTCGLVSAGLPFLATSWVGMTVYYPTLLNKEMPSKRERRQLAAIPLHGNYSLLTAGVVPMLALLLLVVTGVNEKLTVHTAIFIAASIGLFLVAYLVFTRLRDDLTALHQGLKPTKELMNERYGDD